MTAAFPAPSSPHEEHDAGARSALPPSFGVDVRPRRDAVEVCPVGEVDLATVGEVRARIEELRGVGFTRVVLDLREVTFLDSTGLRLMLEEHASAGTDGWEFAVIDGSGPVRRLFDVTGLRSVIRFVDPSPAPWAA